MSDNKSRNIQNKPDEAKDAYFNDEVESYDSSSSPELMALQAELSNTCRQGKSWGEGGAKDAVRSILDTLDRDSLLKQAKGDIMKRLKAGM